MVIFSPLKNKDIPSIQQLALKAWLFTYKNIYTEKRIRKEVAQYYSNESLRRYLSKIRQNKDFFVVAIGNSKVVGYAHIGRKNKQWELLRIYVSPDKLRQGLGSKLISHIESFLKSKNAKKYQVYSHLKNKIANSFYPKVGFIRYKSKDRRATSICFEKQL